MKKLIIAAFAVAFAAAAHAATCNWTGMGVSLLDGTTATSYAVYLLDASVTSASDMAVALCGGDTSKISAATVETTTGIAAGTTAARWNKSGFGNYTAGDSYTYYTVIFNDALSSATQFMITSEKTASVPSSGMLSMTFGTQASNSWQAMSIPEPTSGLLLLLGMGALALRRRRA